MVVFICSQGAYIGLLDKPALRFPLRPFRYLASHRLDLKTDLGFLTFAQKFQNRQFSQGIKNWCNQIKQSISLFHYRLLSRLQENVTGIPITTS